MSKYKIQEKYIKVNKKEKGKKKKLSASLSVYIPTWKNYICNSQQPVFTIIAVRIIQK